ncbi:heme peroxidase, partial [Gonapodya prolifera JEL478]
GPYLVRLAWVDAGSYSIIDGSGGSKATLKLVPPSGGHVSLQTCIDAMELLKENYPAISTADFWAFAGTVAVYESGGPIVPYRCGRTDYKTGEYNASMSAGRLPTGAFNSTQVRKTFTRIGLTDRETVAVIGGGHALGRCHYDRSGYVGPWTNNPLRFTNEFFTLLANSNWSLIVNPNGKTQYNNTDNTKMMLVSDYALWADPAYQSITLEYAKNASLFFSDFTAAYQKLLERG